MTAPTRLGRVGARLSIAVGSNGGVDEELFHCASGGDVAHGAGRGRGSGSCHCMCVCDGASVARQGNGLGGRGEVKGDTQDVSADDKERHQRPGPGLA